MRTIVLGGTGYGGMMLLRILSAHPEITSIIPVSRSSAGTKVAQTDPGLGDTASDKLEATDGVFVTAEQATDVSADVVFAALPHGASASALEPFLDSTPVIDLSADFRLRDPEVYADVYGPHPTPELLSEAVYGLPEWYGRQIEEADIIASPGCYPTATLLPILPFVAEGVLAGPIVVNALSGVSGAGRKESVAMLFAERSENAGAYNPGTGHRHVAEMRQELAAAAATAAGADAAPELLFTPHLVPMKQGIATSIHARMRTPLSTSQAREVIAERYRTEPFTALSHRELPQTRDVRGSNRCDIGVHVEGDHLLLFSCIDNLVKGAAGQAVQAMNIRFDLDESTGLRAAGEF